MECPRCRCEIPHGSISCPECGKPLATFPVNPVEQKKEKSFNPLWLAYGGCGCAFLIVATVVVLLLLYWAFQM